MKNLPRPYRLAIVSPRIGRNDGQGRVNYEIARGALKAGWNVTILATLCDQDLVKNPMVRFKAIKVQKLPTQLLRNQIFDILSRVWLRLHRAEIDILHVNGCVTMAPADVNAAHFVHGAWLRNPFYPFRRWWSNSYTAYQRYYSELNAHSELPAFLRSRSVVAVSRKVSDELQSIGVPPEKITVIYNGVDTDEFHPGKPERGIFKLPDDVPLFLFAGDLRTSRKNLDTVLSALAQIPDLHLAVAGDNSGSPFPAMASKLGITDRVHFLGSVRNMATLMRSVDALVFPSRYECMSLVLLEALASGLPILAAETAGGAEIVGSAGRILENPDDVQTLTEWMNDLKNDFNLRQNMGRAGRTIALQHNWERMARQYCDLYTRIKHSRLHEVTSTLISSKGEA